MAYEWNIRPRGRQCAACEKYFSDAEECVSALFEHDSIFERRDFCLSCWQNRQGPKEPFSSWQGVFEAPAPEDKPEVMHHDTAESLFRRLITLENPDDAGVVYVLAVMLERKKILIERDAKPHPEGGMLRIYEHRKRGDSFMVIDPQLHLDEIGELQQVVADRLGESTDNESAAPKVSS